MSRRAGRFLACTAVVALLLASFSPELGFSKNERILRTRTFGEPATLDWNRASTPVEATLVRNLQEGLVAIGSSLKVIPSIAERWTVSADGKRYLFHLRKNAKWSDGKPVTAQHFVDSWERLLTPDTKANTAYLLFDVEGAEEFHLGKKPFSAVGVRAKNTHTLEVRLRSPVSYWLWIPTFWSTFPIRKDLIEQHGTSWDKPGKLVSAGPYVLTSHEPHKRITLDRNPHYYGKRGNIDQIHAYLISDDRLAAQKFEAAELDFVTRLAAADVERLKNSKELRRWSELRTTHVDLNPNAGPTANLALRRAIFHAIDRRQISKLVSGAYESSTSFIPPSLLGHDKHAGLGFSIKLAKANLKKAKQELGEISPIELVAPAFDDFVLVGEFLRRELQKNLGLEIKVSTFEPKRFYSSAVNFGGYHMILTHWTADYPDPDNFFSIFLSTAGNNRVSWKDAKYDELVLKARSSQDTKTRLRQYKQIQKMLIEEEAIAHPLYYGKNHALVRKSIKGFQPTATNSYLFKDFSMR